jgi:mannose-6-phosphate isomerase-like protein (cupin superfamily)
MVFWPLVLEFPFPVGYAIKGINEEHYHEHMFEIYLVAQGQSKIVVNDTELTLSKGDVLVVEPGEIHMFVSSSGDYLNFIVHAPFIQGDKVSTALN